jgi:mono/diheme cytochrome c family protein
VKARGRSWRFVAGAGGLGAALLAILVTVTAATGPARAGFPWQAWWSRHACENGPPCVPSDVPAGPDWEGTWYWLRSPDQEKRVIAGLYNRYCIRCHGVDGRGVWDIPDVPDFTNARWQAMRSDAQLARTVLEGRGAVMPPFRGTLSLEEAWAMARYLRTFIPGTETPRPDVGQPQKPATPSSAPAPRKVEGSLE